jgi:hypothetical protein
MAQRKETIWNFLIVVCVIILLGYLGGLFVSGIQDPGLAETVGIFVRIACLFLLISLGMKLTQYYMKSLTLEMKEEEKREAEEKEEKQLLFTPTNGSILSFLFLILLGTYGFFSTILSKNAFNADVFAMFIGAIFLIGISLLLWYQQPVFIFAEDSVQIKSHLFYLLGIDRKTVIRYADITSVGPNPKIKANMWGVEPRHSIVISMNGTTQECGLGWFNPDILAKLYLRFKEKLGDKVTME